MRPELANEGIRLARLLADLEPDEPEVLGLQALLEIQASRMSARLDDDGVPVLLESQDRSRWDERLIRAGQAALRKADALATRGRPGRALLPAGQDRGPARPRRTRRGHRLAPDRASVRRPGRRRTRTGRRGEPRRRPRPGVRARPRGWPSSSRSTPLPSATRRSSRASTATCSSASGSTPTPRRPSPRRRAAPATSGNDQCSCVGRRRTAPWSLVSCRVNAPPSSVICMSDSGGDREQGVQPLRGHR